MKRIYLVIFIICLQITWLIGSSFLSSQELNSLPITKVQGLYSNYDGKTIDVSLLKDITPMHIGKTLNFSPSPESQKLFTVDVFLTPSEKGIWNVSHIEAHNKVLPTPNERIITLYNFCVESHKMPDFCAESDKMPHYSYNFTPYSHYQGYQGRFILDKSFLPEQSSIKDSDDRVEEQAAIIDLSIRQNGKRPYIHRVSPLK